MKNLAGISQGLMGLFLAVGIALSGYFVSPRIAQFSFRKHWETTRTVVEPRSSNGALGTNRTCDPPLRRGMLYPLSYEGILIKIF